MRVIIVIVLVLICSCSNRPVNTDGHVRSDGELPACGSQSTMARFASCIGSSNRSACEQAGGSWHAIGLSDDPICVCPTGQAGCSCDRSSDCLGACLAEMSTMWDCSDARGTCSDVAPNVGCWCWFDDQGNASGICAD